MTARATLRRVSTGVAVFCLLFLVLASSSQGAGADDPIRVNHASIAKQDPNQLRATAEAAEKSGDWETAFAAYCRLFVLDRSAPDLREKLNVVMRRAQQQRRHRDPQFQRFVASTSVSDALYLYAEVMAKVPILYVDRDRCRPQQLWESGIDELTRALASGTFRQTFLSTSEQGAEKIETFRNSLRTWAKQPIADSHSARSTLRKLIASAQEATSVRLPSALVFEMVCGSCNGLDEYTIFLNPSQSNTDSATTADLTAQGIYLATTEEGPVISGIAAGSWAALITPQLRKGDRIVRLNGHSMEMATPAMIADAIRNPVDKGETHVLEIAGSTPEDPPLEFHLPVVVPTVYGARVLSVKDGKDPIGYARIGSFGPNTPRELDDAIQLLKAREGVRALVLDLRGNMGGSFLASVETAKRLVPSGLIVTTQGQHNEVANQTFSSDSGMTAHDIPIVALIDAETASAAEVLAAALKDNNRATLIGMPTFGKGAIQYPLKLEALDGINVEGKPKVNRSGTVRLTIAKLIAPRGGAINGVGITPHFLEADPERQLNLAQEKAVELLQALPRGMMIP